MPIVKTSIDTDNPFISQYPLVYLTTSFASICKQKKQDKPFEGGFCNMLWQQELENRHPVPPLADMQPIIMYPSNTEEIMQKIYAKIPIN